MIVSFFVVCWEYKAELFLFLSLTEGTDVVVNSMADYVWGCEDELTGALRDKVDIWD